MNNCETIRGGIRNYHSAFMRISLTLLAALLSLALTACVPSAYVPPILRASGELEYPAEASKAGTTGSVTVAYDIEVDGKVTNIHVIDSDPPAIFDEAAMEYVSSWRFQPEKRNDVPVVSKNRHSKIEFSLDKPDASYVPFLRKDGE